MRVAKEKLLRDDWKIPLALIFRLPWAMYDAKTPTLTLSKPLPHICLDIVAIDWTQRIS